MLVLAALLNPAGPGHAREALPKDLEGVQVAERLGGKLAADVTFTRHDGRRVRLSSYLDSGKPLLLTLNYYRCPMLCSLQLNALVRGLGELAWRPGERFNVVTISIDPKEGPELARKKRASYLRALGIRGASWDFLVGDAEGIGKVAQSVGFGYRYVPEQDQFAHPAVIFFVAPDGTITRYLYGIEYAARQLKLALLDTAGGRIGSTVERILLSCFHYDDKTGRYTPFAFGIMRLGGGITLALLLALVGYLWIRERRGRRRVSSA